MISIFMNKSKQLAFMDIALLTSILSHENRREGIHGDGLVPDCYDILAFHPERSLREQQNIFNNFGRSLN